MVWFSNVHALAIVPTIRKPYHSKFGSFCPDFHDFLTKWPLFVWISNGWANRFCIPFEIQTICKPTLFSTIQNPNQSGFQIPTVFGSSSVLLDVSIILGIFKIPSRGCSHQSCEQNSGDANRMLGWHREDMFDKESVKFDHLPKKYKLKDSYKTHPAATGIQPTTWSPALGCKLKYEKKIKIKI